MTRRKPVDPEAVRRRTGKAILALRKFVVIAGQEEWITVELSSILNKNIFGIDEILMLALPPAPGTAV